MHMNKVEGFTISVMDDFTAISMIEDLIDWRSRLDDLKAFGLPRQLERP